MNLLVILCLISTAVMGQGLPQQYSLRDCVIGTPESLGLVGSFNEGLIPDSCVSICNDKSYDLAFITGGTNAKCYCGDAIPTQNDPPPLVVCQSPCTDGFSLGCGSDGLFRGLPAFAVYLINGNTIKTNSPKLTDPLALLPPAKFIYIGFASVVFAVVFIISTFAWIARDRENKKLK